MEFPERFELGERVDFYKKVGTFRRALALAALREGGNLTQAAGLLGINRSTLVEIMKRQEIKREEWHPESLNVLRCELG